jgi:hypothetical protein
MVRVIFILFIEIIKHRPCSSKKEKDEAVAFICFGNKIAAMAKRAIVF